MMRTRKRSTKPDQSGPGITTTAHSTASLQDGCDNEATGANQSIKLGIKGKPCMYTFCVRQDP
ncbi:hypothetical protein DPMN_069533 [Dreissena polymorpha]|uniref:Uncharacterized protein n=1 Tax=Dreissena polymorpha TaxID=45954 RepID=A0A9D3Z4B6_DREPO|nr:hypothetical protein DPMN_069533 [Dreissena polymorpha]